jgi:hypothetical protein
MRRGLWILCLAGAFAACKGEESDQPTGDTGQDTSPVDTSPPTRDERITTILGLIPTGDVANGKLAYEGVPGCWECHLLDGSGEGPYPALTERLPIIDDVRVAVVIFDGLPPPASSPTDPGMPSYGDVPDIWTDQTIANTIAYIRSAFDTAR